MSDISHSSFLRQKIIIPSVQMKLLVCVVCLVGAGAMAAPSSDAAAARRGLPALRHEEVHDEFGQYAWRYVTAEGTVAAERGWLVPTPDRSSYVLVSEGETSYVGDDGNTYVTKYSSGLDGTHVEGAHLPKPVQASI